MILLGVVGLDEPNLVVLRLFGEVGVLIAILDVPGVVEDVLRILLYDDL